jgi:hypothetical protein
MAYTVYDSKGVTRYESRTAHERATGAPSGATFNKLHKAVASSAPSPAVAMATTDTMGGSVTWASLYPGQNLAYRYTACIAGAHIDTSRRDIQSASFENGAAP